MRDSDLHLHYLHITYVFTSLHVNLCALVCRLFKSCLVIGCLGHVTKRVRKCDPSATREPPLTTTFKVL